VVDTGSSTDTGRVPGGRDVADGTSCTGRTRATARHFGAPCGSARRAARAQAPRDADAEAQAAGATGRAVELRIAMSNATLGLPEDLHAYLLEVGVREPEVLRDLRAETAALPEHDMQIAPEQGAFMALLVELIGARRCLEVGTFTGYSSIAVALAMPPGGTMVCCDVSREWTDVARRYWERAGVADRIELRLGPALDSLDALLTEGQAATFDFAFLDADKVHYPEYADRAIALLRPGGLLAIDNVFWGGEITNPDADDDSVRAIRSMSRALAEDGRVSLAMVPIADGLTLARKR
jgi:predicted O-methyltransferase YrrM